MCVLPNYGFQHGWFNVNSLTVCQVALFEELDLSGMLAAWLGRRSCQSLWIAAHDAAYVRGGSVRL